MGLNHSFKRVALTSVFLKSSASFVGLEADRRMADIKTFELCRSRIPMERFRSIVEDIDLMQVQYGHPLYHETEETRSRFLSPVSTGQLPTQQSE